METALFRMSNVDEVMELIENVARMKRSWSCTIVAKSG